MGIVSSGVLILGIAGAGTGFAEDSTCDGRGGMLTTATGKLCDTLNTATSGLQTPNKGSLAAGLRTAADQVGAVANGTARRIDGARPAPAPGGGQKKHRKSPKKGATDRTDRTVDPAVRGPIDAPFAGLRPPPAIADAGPDQRTARLPEIALEPQRTPVLAAAPENGADGLRWIALIAVGSSAIGLVGGGHLGLLAARGRRRRVPDA